jgi:hypothetical protein
MLRADTALGNPELWSQAYKTLDTLTPGYQIEPILLDYYLSWEWFSLSMGTTATTKLKKQKAYYLSQATVQNILQENRPNAIHKHILLPENQPIEMLPVIFLTQDPVSSCLLVLFDYGKEEAIVFGHTKGYGPTDMHADWTPWKGLIHWTDIAQVFNWEMNHTQPKVIEPNWGQVCNCIIQEYFLLTYFPSQLEPDLRPWMITIAKNAFENGWDSTKDINGHPVKPDLACAHQMRSKIFHTVLQASQASYKFWEQFRNRMDYTTLPSQNTIDDMKTGPWKFNRYKRIAIALASIQISCRSCQGRGDLAGDLAQTYSQVNPGQLSPRPVSDASGTEEGSGQMALATSVFSSREAAMPIPIPDNSNTDTTIPLTVSLEDFDDYDTAKATFDEPDIIPETWTFNGQGSLVLEKYWSIWRDRGYRLDPAFFSMFGFEGPILHIEHLLPHANLQSHTTSDDEETEIQNHDNHGQPPDSRGLPDRTVPDLAILGAQEMLDEAGPMANTDPSQKVFVCGRTQDDQFIQLNLQKDGVECLADDVDISIDIDSVIWVTHNLQFKGPMNLHLLPLLGDQAPVSKNNHVYIQVLCPPTADEEGLGIRSKKHERFPISAIPHTHFGQIGQGTGQFNVYVFFPRMIRKDPCTRRMNTLIPREVQDLWLSDVVIPASRDSLKDFPGTLEYLPTDLEQLRWRMNNANKTKTIPITPLVLSILQANIKELIKKSPELLGRFGSHFFVVDSRGLKLLAKQHEDNQPPYETLCVMVPELDWDHMRDRLQGELFLDLGISYHPPNNGHPLVGLWRLDETTTSYEMMDMKKGTTHHSCTLAGYGGKQAEMKQDRCKKVHLCFRSTYNLCFEVVRQPGQKNYLCTDIDAIKVNKNFLTGCERWELLFRGAESRSFGVREEVRGSGNTIIELLDVVQVKVRCRNLTKINELKLSYRQDIIWHPNQFFGSNLQPGFVFSQEGCLSSKMYNFISLACTLTITASSPPS